MRTKVSEDKYLLPEPVGSQPKYWLEMDGKRYLFKLATYKQDKTPVYNDISECMAADIANVLGISAAKYLLCEDSAGRKGVLSEDFLNNATCGPKREEFYDGVYLINQIDPDFKNTSLINPKTHQYYTVDLVLQSIERFGLQKDVLNMLIFDALIANRDRNPSNYGIIIDHKTRNIRFAPLYDSATSLGLSLVDHRLERCFDKDGNIVDEEHLNNVIHHQFVGKITLERFSQYGDKKLWDSEEEKRILTLIEDERSKLIPLVESGKITVDEYHKRLNSVGNQYRKFDITTLQYQTLMKYLTFNYPNEIEEVMHNVAKLDREKIDEVFDKYKEQLPIARLNMAKELVSRRASWMKNYYYENKNESRVAKGGK